MMIFKYKALYVVLSTCCSLLFMNAQVSVTIDEDASWRGYMHIFHSNSGEKGGYIYGQAWAVEDLIALLSTNDTQTITLKPNTSQYNSTDSYWSNGNGDGNKWMEANTYIEYASGNYPGGTLTFTANIDSYTLDTRYIFKAFIKEFNQSYDLVGSEFVEITADMTSFNISYTPTNNSNVVQYGFICEGINANPVTDWGQVVVSSTASHNEFVYQEVWADEFDNTGAVDQNKWFHQTIMPNGYSWYNGELQHYTDEIENTYVSNGTLKIVAKAENYPDQGHTKQFTSARLNSKFAFTYGKVEVRAKLPTGVGTWPAIWMLGKNINETGAYWQQEGYGTTSWPACGEIDIMEHWGKNQNYVSSAMHTPSSHGGTINHGGQMISTVSSEFHVYKLEWTEEKMVFSVDDNVHYTYQPSVKDASTWPFDADQYLLLNIAIEENTNPATFVDAIMEIDYVRVYQKQLLSSKKNNEKVPLYIWINQQNEIEIQSVQTVNAVRLFDLNGRELSRLKPNVNHVKIDANAFSGVLLVKVEAQSNQWIQKILIQ